jgi:hypothetical protein
MAQSKFSSQATTMHTEAAAHSDRDRGRPQNEDAIALCEPSDERANLLLPCQRDDLLTGDEKPFIIDSRKDWK